MQSYEAEFGNDFGTEFRLFKVTNSQGNLFE